MITKTKKPFAGNGLSRTAMVFKIATMAKHKLTVVEMNKIKTVNPRSLESVYTHLTNGGGGNSSDAMFALRLILK